MKIIEEKIQWKPNSKWDKNNPDKIIIHHALSRKCTIHDINQWHLDNGWNGFGYHYFIDKKGNIYKGRLHSWNGCHTVGKNEQSLGICLEGCYTNYIRHGSKIDMVEKTVPEEQLNSTIDLLIYLGLPYYYHRDFTDEKDCPGKYFYTKDELKSFINNKNNPSNKKITFEELCKCLDDPSKFLNAVNEIESIANKNSDIGVLEQLKYIKSACIKFFNYGRKFDK